MSITMSGPCDSQILMSWSRKESILQWSHFSHTTCSTFALFKELHMDKYTPKPGASWDPKPGQLVPYFLRGLNTVELYNDVQVPIANDPKAPSATGKSFKITGLPEK